MIITFFITEVSIFSVEGCQLHTEIQQTYADSRSTILKT
jgi:hypothetical protein